MDKFIPNKLKFMYPSYTFDFEKENSNNNFVGNHGLLNPFFNKFNWNYRLILSENKPHVCKNKLKISIIDTGVDPKHPFFLKNKFTGKSFVDNSEGLTDEVNHGTKVAGILNTLISNAEIISYKIMNKNKIKTSFNLVKSIYDSVDEGVDIINISFGTYKDINNKNDRIIINAYDKAVNYAYDNNVIIVSSAGNEGINLDYHNKIHLPGNHDKVIGVGGSTKFNLIAPYSNFGQKVDIYAPSGLFKIRKGKLDISEMIVSYSPSYSLKSPINSMDNLLDNFTFIYGTSFSVPHVVAALAVEVDLYPNKGFEFYKNKLLNKASVIKTQNGYSFKELRMYSK